MAKLDKLSDAEVSTQLDELREERRAFVREHASILRDDAHTAFERSREEARKTCETAFRVLEPRDYVRGFPMNKPMGGHSLFELATLWAAGHDETFAAYVHAAIDRLEGWSPLSRGDYDKRLAKLDADIAEREGELKRRDIDRRRQELESELATLEVGA